MRTRHTALALALTAALAATTSPAYAGAPVVEVNPPKLPSATSSSPHLEGTTIVDGATRIAVAGAHVRLLGEVASGYLVESTKKDSASTATILRYAADGTATRIGRSDYYSARLSDDGATVVGERVRRRATLRTELTAYAVATGAVVAVRSVKGYTNLLDADAGRVAIGSFDNPRGTQLWTLADNTLQLVTRRTGQAADLRRDLLATYSKDPYEGGITVLSRLSRPGKRLWSSKDERVEEFSTDGSRMVLAGILDDGIGPGAVVVRSVSGQRLVTYDAAGGWFGDLTFESPTALVIDAHGPRRSATVRCTDTTCERIGALTRTTY